MSEMRQWGGLFEKRKGRESEIFWRFDISPIECENHYWHQQEKPEIILIGIREIKYLPNIRYLTPLKLHLPIYFFE